MITLAAHLEGLDTWLASLPGAPMWTGHLIVEQGHVTPGVGGRPTFIAAAPPQSAAAYAARFAELLRAGCAWINLHAAGVVGGRLLVSVEFPHATRAAAGATSVNLSGPAQAVAERDGWPIELQHGGP